MNMKYIIIFLLTMLLIIYFYNKRINKRIKLKLYFENVVLGKNIYILGASGSGKTTLSCNISKLLNKKHLELDSIYWKNNWEESSISEFRDLVHEYISKNEDFIIDGNYSKVRDIILPYVNTIIWLNYTKEIHIYRVLKRSLYRIFTKKELWNKKGTIETFSNLFSKNSIIIWSWKGNDKINDFIEEYKLNNNIQIIEFRNPLETNMFINFFKKK